MGADGDDAAIPCLDLRGVDSDPEVAAGRPLDGAHETPDFGVGEVERVEAPAVVSGDTSEAALLVAPGVLGFVVASAVPVAVGGLGPLTREEWRRRGARH